MTAAVIVDQTNDDQVAVRYEFDVEKLNRQGRRRLDSSLEDYRRRYRNVRGPNGERPTLVLRQPGTFTSNVVVIVEFPEAMKDVIQGSDQAVRVA